MDNTLKKINELGISLPEAAKPAANYVSYVVSNNQIFISGQLPMENGQIKHTGIVGENVSVDDAVDAARICGLNIISQVSDCLEGKLDRVAKIVKLTGFVNGVSGFGEQPKIINGASDLMVEIFGERGKHTRAAVGAGSLPFNVSVEIDAIVEFK